MVSKGVVTKTNGDYATVLVQRSSACGHDCGECNLCKNPQIETNVLNPINAKAGDTVVIETDTPKVLKNAFMLYMLPVIVFFVSYIMGVQLTEFLTFRIALICVCLLLWLLFIRTYSKKHPITSIAKEVIYEKD